MDATPIDEGPVGAAEIVNHEQLRAVVRALNAGVQSGNGAVGEGQRRGTRYGRGAPPDVEGQLGHHDQARGPQGLHRGAVANHDERALPGPFAVEAATWRDGLRNLVRIDRHGSSSSGQFWKTSSYTTGPPPKGAQPGGPLVERPLRDALGGRPQRKPGPMIRPTQRGGCVLPRGTTGWPLPGRPTMRPS